MERLARRQAIVLLAAVLALDSADKATLGAVAGELKPDFGIGNAELGLLAASTSIVSAVATVPMGVLTDRVRRVRLLAISVCVWGAAMVWTALAQSYDSLLFSRLALGAGLAAAGPLVASLVGDLFAPRERGKIYGYILSGELVGAGIGFLVAGNIAGLVSWRGSFGLLALAGLVLAWVVWRRLPEPERASQGPLDWKPGKGLAQRVVRREHVEPVEELVMDEDPARMPLGRALRYVVRVRTNVVLIVATASGYFFFSGLRTFGVVFARGHFSLGQSVASTLFTLVGAGALAGVLLGGRLADSWLRRGRVDARIVVAIIGFVIAAVVLLPALLTRSLVLALPLYFVGAAAFSMPNPPLDAARLDVMPPGLWGRAEGLRTVIRTAAEAGAPLLFALVAGMMGGSGRQHHANGLMYAFLVALVPLALNGVILLWARKSYPADVATAAASTERIKTLGESAEMRRAETPAFGSHAWNPQ